MNIRPKLRNAVLVGALAAITATAWAANESLSDAAYVPAGGPAIESRAATAIDPATTDSATMNDAKSPVAVEDSLAPNESIVAAGETRPAPVVERSVGQPGITVQDRKLSGDQRIQLLVMDKLASNRNISGRIGVESHDAVVKLSGYTVTAGQAWRAGRDARSIVGVKYVQNEIRPRIGGTV